MMRAVLAQNCSYTSPTFKFTAIKINTSAAIAQIMAKDMAILFTKDFLFVNINHSWANSF